ncbi:hypothetical protein [uncultured Sulfitobacter sp.]|uniref:hypothetical protein n=1 Tax=uncultured Sulfitobacter sp. TaxID=191468 RepID=UPI0026325979|nr:hypothetical protein [uncultured Sulfitobacter sp.]
MTQTDFNSAPQVEASSSLGARLALPVAVFAGTIAINLFAATGADDMCRVCPVTPVQDALPWAAGAALLVIVLQTLGRVRGQQ